jgi:transglutaminase-like putative cysteine protease
MSVTGWAPSALREPIGGARRCSADARLPVAAARMIGFLALAAFGTATWARMVDPAATLATVVTLLAALVAGGALIAAGRRQLGRLPRALVTAAVGLALLVVALAASGIPTDLAGPRDWDDVAAGISQGLGAVPNVRVPFHGADPWTRIVIVLGSGVLVGLATLLAFAPRREGRLGFPAAAAIVLAVLYLVPAMQHEGAHPFLGGAALALLLALFLWLERIERRAAPMAAAVVAIAVLAALVLAPRIDGGHALLDYEGLAQDLSAGPSTRYDWNHGYGPLNWPRDGREVLRVQARDRAYWKAAELSAFDGTHWVQAPPRSQGVNNASFDPGHRDWTQVIRVTMRALRSSTFIGAGTTFEIRDSPREAVPNGLGLWRTGVKALKRGNAYRAVVYTPRPTVRELRTSTDLPLPVGTDDTTIGLPGTPTPAGNPTRGARVSITPWGQGETPPRAIAAIEASPYKGAYELARRLRASSATPYDFMLAVERHLGRGYTYSESPPPSRAPLESFLFRDKVGYCQQFSGAMALLLRLGGVPARVAAGFSPGVYDAKRKEFVVRDLDAHSWVEVFYPSIGWITRDPTPSDSPARSQTDDLGRAAQNANVDVSDAGGAGADGPASSGATGGPARSGDGGGPALLVIGLGLGLAGVVVVFGLLLVIGGRRRLPARVADLGAGQLAELQRALRRTRRTPAAPTTLEVLAARYRGTAAEDYVRALAAARYGYGDAGPTPAQRAALRRELAIGRGLRRRLRAWWALPPQPSLRRLRRRSAEH